MRKIVPLIVLMLFCALFATAQNLNQAEAAKALQLVEANKASIGLSADVQSNLMVSSTFEDQVTGIRYVYLYQAYKGIPVFNQMLVLSFKNGKLSTKSGIFDPEMEQAVGSQSGSPSVSAASAVQSALSDRGFRASQMAIALKTEDQGRFVEFGNMGISQQNITAQLMWVPTEEIPAVAAKKVDPTTDVASSSVVSERYKLAWQVYIIPKTTPDYWLVRVNAADNSILGNTNLTDHDNWGTPDENANIRYPDFAMNKGPKGEDQKNVFDFNKTEDPSLVSAATYRVIPIPYEAPSFMPGASTTWHAIRSNPWTNAPVANATTLNWHTGAAAADYDYTRGNNVWAYQDRTPSNNTGTIAKSASSTTPLPTLTFDFTPDYTLEPTVTTPPNQQFNITNLFYWNNLIHDIFYGYGFTEVGGNFQDDNLGRGGVGNDHVNAEAQDGSGSNNANFSTPADGGSGRMQMYLWTAPTPDRDGDVDNGIIIHEFGHGIGKRITGGPANTACLTTSEQGGEGISDYFGLMLTQDWAAATVNTGFNSPRGIGTYALNQPTTGPGIRPTRYTTDFAINPTTYTNISTLAVPHGVGYAWCTILWEMTWEVIKETNTINPNIYAWDGTEGNVRALRMVMEGLRTQPCQPGFVDARNNILTASQTLYGGAYDCAIWRAFARRGVGFSALQGSNNRGDETPAFDLPPACITAGPTVTINQAAAQPDPTSTSPINFTVVFSEAVQGFTTGDVTIGGTAGATTQVVTGGPTTYNVAVSGMTSGGTVVATIAAGVCTSVALNEPNNASTSTDNSVTYLMAPPGTCTTFVGTVGPANNPVGLRAFRDGTPSTCAAPGPCTPSSLTGALHYVQHTWTNPINAPQCVTVTYTNTATNFSFVTAHNGSVVLTNFCTNWLGDPGSSATAGTPIVWSFTAPALATIVFHVGNVTPGQTAGYMLDIQAAQCNAGAPTVTINQAAAQPDPTSTEPINFTAVFSEPVTGFTTGDVTLSGTAGATSATVSGGPTTYNVAVTGMTSSGTVIASIAAGVCTSVSSSTPNVASTSSDNTVTFNLVVGCTSVNPIISDTVCNGATHPGRTFTSPTPGTTFSWVNSNTSIGLAASGTGNIAPFTATNPGTTPQVATVTVTPFVNVTATFTGSLDVPDPALPVRLFRDGIPSTCASPKAFPGTFGTGPYLYDVHTFTNPSLSPACITATISTTSANFAHVIAYLGSFDPTNQATNYIADCGFSGNTTPSTFSFTAPAGATIVFVVQQPFVGATVASYTMNISMLCAGNPRSFNITVNPTGQVNQPANQVVCKGSPTAPVNFTTTTPGSIFNWTNDMPAIGLAANGTGDIPSFIAQNPGSTPIVATITVTPQYGTGGLMVQDSFLYTGAVQTWVVPAGVTSINVKAWGGQGNNNTNGNPGGLGGYAEGDLAVTPGQTLWFNVGGGATTNRLGAFNGGGDGGVTGCATAMGGGGGGASDVRNTANTLANRRIVAGGGGGAAGDRRAACGRGTGGGGGGGYYGGGGGAGWPFASTVVPTGGTQTAGGIGGTSTYTGAPNNNGFPGALGIGGRGGDEVASNQGTPSRVGPPGGEGGGLVGGNGQYVLANTWTGQSGAGGSSYIGGVTGGSTTANVRTGAGKINISYAAAGVSCIGTPKTFTITVNPNAALVIVADPGTVICKGDPTLLTVYDAAPGAGANVSITHSSSNTITPGNSVACNAGTTGQVNSYWRAYKLSDFPTVTGDYTITSVRFGIEAIIGGSVPITVNLYNQTGAAFPGGTRTLIKSQTYNLPAQTNSTYTATFTTPVTVPNSATVIVEVTNATVVPGVRFFIGSNAAAETDISYLSSAACGIVNPTPIGVIGFPNMHMIIGLNGTLPNLGPQSTGTFLWSPAAGLSSTTSNPVAASPMVTTTYTVRRTTAAGCRDSASITITVKERPKVTTQPIASTVCATHATSFTVGGTGAGLAYQWQVNTSGCTGGTWTNLTNGGPYSGVTTATLTVDPTTVAMNGYGYRCVLTGDCSAIPGENISNCVVLTVNPLPVVTVTPTSACGGVAGMFGTALTASGANTYTWSPVAGLYLDAAATVPYTGGNANPVYAAPTVATKYTVVGTFTATGCKDSTTTDINYTPPPPVVVPSSVTMCLGDPAVKLKASTSSAGSVSFASGPLNLNIPDGPGIPPVPTSYPAVSHGITVSGIPAGATITGVRAKLNITHPWVSDMVIALKAPNGQVINLSALLNRTNNPGANFTNTVISSASNTAQSAGTAPYTGTFRADLVGATFTAFGFTFPGGPVGFVPTSTAWNSLYSTPNGVWSIGMYDAGAPDGGTFNNWSIDIDYLIGVPATPAVWTPAAGLFLDAAATVPYPAGTEIDSVWTRPTPAGVYNYDVTVKSINVSGTIPLPTQGATFTGSVRGYFFTAPSSFTMTSVEVPTDASTGPQSIAVVRFTGATPPPAFPGTTNAFTTLFLTQNNPAAGAIPVSININAGDVIGIMGYRATVNSYSSVVGPSATVINGAPVNLSRMGMQFPLTTTAPQQIWSEVAGRIGRIQFSYGLNVPQCTSPARRVVVTVHAPTTVTTQPVARTICTDKVATFTVAAGGSGPFSYQWQVSTNGNNPPWTNVSNGGVYSGATSPTLTITAPPVTLNGNFYRCVITGAAPCAPATSFGVRLTVNPLPTVVISASPYTSLFPGLVTTLSSTVSPNAAATYTWVRNGTNVPGGSNATLSVDVDGLGDYQLTVTDVNGCTNKSNIVTIKDSASGKCFLYPNPNGGQFEVRYHSVANNVLPRTLTIYNSAGVRVSTQRYTIGRPYDRMAVDLRNQSKGAYWVEIGDLNGARLAMCRVVVQ